MKLSGDEVRARLRDWIEGHVEGWRNVRLRPLEVALGSGFSAEIFFVDVDYDDAAGAQSRTLVVRRQPADLEVVVGSSLELQGRMMAALDRLKLAPVPDWIGMELDPAVPGGGPVGHAKSQLQHHGLACRHDPGATCGDVEKRDRGVCAAKPDRLAGRWLCLSGAIRMGPTRP